MLSEVSKLEKTTYDSSLSGRLSSLVNRIIHIRGNTDRYERVLGEYTQPRPPQAESEPVDETTPSVFDLIREMEMLVTDIEITQSNLNAVIV